MTTNRTSNPTQESSTGKPVQSPHTVAVIGGGGRGRAHAEGWQQDSRCQLVAVADPVEASRSAFCERFGDLKTFADYAQMLAAETPQIVSVCTWPHLHREMVEAGVLLTFCHQRRFGETFASARALIRNGAIGNLRRFEGTCPNLFDWGTHWFDMAFFFNEETPVEWVMGQIDVAEERSVFGVRLDTSGLSWFRFANGVEGLMATGDTAYEGPAIV